METSLGNLVLLRDDQPAQTYELGKARITLGRAAANDIVLADPRASRYHARLECSPAGCRIVDLGSANGTRVNGLPVQSAAIAPGDRIEVAGTQFAYELVSPASDPGLTAIESEADLALSVARETLPVTVNETGAPRLVIFTDQATWEVPLDDQDQVRIGRTDDNQVVIEQSSVSRQHAEVRRRGGLFVLRDLGSTNGTWLREETVTEEVLRDGDVFRIGPAQLVFKGGFAPEALTMADESLARQPVRRPVVFVPGIMGSQLWAGSERVWPNIGLLLKNPEVLRYAEGGGLTPRGIVDEVVIVPNLIKQDQYNRLGDYLEEELGYERDRDFFEFAYDWRQDVRISARQLGQFLDTLPRSVPLTLITHSLGTLVGRYYTECLGGKQRIGRLIMMGGPHAGAVKGLTSLLAGPSILPFGLLGEKLRRVVATFPTSYQIIPTYACGVDQHGNKINFLSDETWVGPAELPLLRMARQFRDELPRSTSVPATSIFGYGLKTITGFTATRAADGAITQISYHIEPSGDQSVPERSAVLADTDIHPVQQYHGSLFVDADVKMRLKLELAGGLAH